MREIQSIDVIAIDPTVRNGRPFIVGTTIEVSAIVIATIVHRQSPDEIATDYRLTLTQVHAALAYYYDFSHKAEIDASINYRREVAEHYKKQAINQRPNIS